jgi:hypothetical protein
MISTTLIEKLEQLSPELQKKIEEEVDGLLNDGKNQATNIVVSKKITIKPGFGGAKGLFGEMTDDFDAPLEGFKDYM